LVLELEHLKTETKLISERFANALSELFIIRVTTKAKKKEKKEEKKWNKE